MSEFAAAMICIDEGTCAEVVLTVVDTVVLISGTVVDVVIVLEGSVEILVLVMVGGVVWTNLITV
jgi:hypothetical protein